MVATALWMPGASVVTQAGLQAHQPNLRTRQIEGYAHARGAAESYLSPSIDEARQLARDDWAIDVAAHPSWLYTDRSTYVTAFMRGLAGQPLDVLAE